MSEDTLCNFCGDSMMLPCGNDPSAMPTPHGLVNARVSGGYFSEHLLDLVTYQFSLCEKCLRFIFDRCKVPVTVSNEGEKQHYSEEKELFEYNLWLHADGRKKKLGTGLCNYNQHCKEKAVWRSIKDCSLHEEAYCEAHKERNKGYFDYWAPVEAFKKFECEQGGQPLDGDDTLVINPTRDKELFAVIASYYYGKKIVFDKFLPPIFHRIIDLNYRAMQYMPEGSQDQVCGVWIPHGVELAPEIQRLGNSVTFNTGTMYWEQYAVDRNAGSLLSMKPYKVSAELLEFIAQTKATVR